MFGRVLSIIIALEIATFIIIIIAVTAVDELIARKKAKEEDILDD